MLRGMTYSAQEGVPAAHLPARLASGVMLMSCKAPSQLPKLAAVIAGVAVVLLSFESRAVPTVIEILCTSTEGCGKFIGTTPDGTTFLANPEPTMPSTGTGVFQPWKRVQKHGAGQGALQSGFNSDTASRT